MKRGLLLMNTGSPDSHQAMDLRRFLKEFLMDPHVIDLPFPLRYALVNWMILPRRPAESAEAYRKIWTDHGSPLIHYCTELANRLSERVNEPVALGMAYGNPSFKGAVGKLLDEGVDEIGLLPMFPHYAMATTTACIAGVQAELKRRRSRIPLRVVPPFYAEPTFIQPLAELLKGVEGHILFSYHGLPERHLRKTDPTEHHCLSSATCCSESSMAHDTCYRFQCLSTTRAIVKEADIEEGRYSISFQSRLGRAKWLTPYTEEVLQRLPAQGIQKLAVICPAFFCDCLETLEEIDIRGRETFMNAGGESFRMIPCLNDTPAALHCLETLAANVGNWPVEE